MGLTQDIYIVYYEPYIKFDQNHLFTVMDQPINTSVLEQEASATEALIETTPNAKLPYELIIVSPNLTDDEATKVLQRTIAILQGAGCTVQPNVAAPMRSRFAYTIKNTRQGLYHFIRFDAETQSIKTITRELHLVSDIIRFQIERNPGTQGAPTPIAKEKEVVAEAPTVAAETPVTQPPRGWTVREKTESTPVAKVEAPAEPTVTIEDLDKKLEDILGE